MAVTAVALKRKVYDSPEEMALVHRAKHGDQDAFTALYNHHFNRLRIVINRMIKNESESEWLANVAMTKTWEHLKEFDEKSKFSTWVTRTAINEGLMYLRHQKTQRQSMTCSLDEITDGNRNTNRGFATRDLNLEGVADREVLARAISRVPVEYREILRLRFWEGLSVQDCRKRLGVPKRRMSAVKTRLLRGRKMLQEQVEKASTTKLDIFAASSV
jgi:RNA polymerase sigma-70 factor (ECF subfamily)